MELIAGAALRRRLRDDPPLLTGLVDPETQIQMNGVDLTLAEVSRFGAGPGRVDFDNASRRIPSPEPLAPDRDGVYRLAAGPWWVRYNEVVNVPPDVFAIGRTRSSLLRSGAADRHRALGFGVPRPQRVPAHRAPSRTGSNSSRAPASSNWSSSSSPLRRSGPTRAQYQDE